MHTYIRKTTVDRASGASRDAARSAFSAVPVSQVQFSDTAESRRSSGERVWLQEKGNASKAAAKDKSDKSDKSDKTKEKDDAKDKSDKSDKTKEKDTKQKHDAKDKDKREKGSVQFSQRPEAGDHPTSTPSNWNLGPDDDSPDKGPGHWSDDLIAAKKLAGILWSSVTYAVLWRFALDRFPVLEWLPKYTWTKFSYDLQAGLVVGCILIPQGMAYADVAGLPYVVGLYSGFAPLIIYYIHGTSRQMGVGPVAIVSLIMAQGVPVCNKLCPGT